MPYSNVVRTLLAPLLAFVLLTLGSTGARAEPVPPPPQVPVRAYVRPGDKALRMDAAALAALYA